MKRERECLLLIKTSSERFDALRERIVALHPYELHEVIAVDIAWATRRTWRGSRQRPGNEVRLQVRSIPPGLLPACNERSRGRLLTNNPAITDERMPADKTLRQFADESTDSHALHAARRSRLPAPSTPQTKTTCCRSKRHSASKPRALDRATIEIRFKDRRRLLSVSRAHEDDAAPIRR